MRLEQGALNALFDQAQAEIHTELLKCIAELDYLEWIGTCRLWWLQPDRFLRWRYERRKKCLNS